MIRMYEINLNDTDLISLIALEQSFRKLPERQQAIIGLRLLDYTQESVAKLLSISRTTIWMDEKAGLTQLGASAFEGMGGEDA